MWQETQSEKLKDEIELLLAPLSEVSGLYDMAIEPLTAARRALSPGDIGTRSVALLPLIVCESIAGTYEHAIPAAAALQLFMAAGDVFDDIEDADSTESISAKYGPAIATNVATALLILGERGFTRLKSRGVADGVIVQVMDTLNTSYTAACIGQHLDLSLACQRTVSEDTYLRVADMKSASQIGCACSIGAILATTNQKLIEMFRRFGHNLGMAAQVANDIQGISTGSDILRHKATFPIIYALAQTDGETQHEIKLAFDKQANSVDVARIKELLFRAGAMHYATIKVEYYRQNARDILADIEKSGAVTERLKQFLG